MNKKTLPSIILRRIPQDDLILAIRAACYLLERFQKDAIVCYGEGGNERCFYVRRNKSSISVCPTAEAEAT